jgi:hypothetical protein
MKDKPKYDLSDALPDDPDEVERQIEYWMSCQNAGEAGSNWEVWVQNKLEQLRWKEQKLLRSAKSEAVEVKIHAGLPVIFLSCGQYDPKEKQLGNQVKAMLEKSGCLEVYFAENQSTFEGLTQNILSALNRCVGFIGILHHRGQVIAFGKTTIRASVWIEQEIAIAAFIEHVLARKIKVQLYIEHGIALEGMREKLLLNPLVFGNNEEVLAHLGGNVDKWVSLKATTPASMMAFDQKVKTEKHDFYARTRGGRDGNQVVRSETHLWAFVSPFNFKVIELDVNFTWEFLPLLYRYFWGHHRLADSQGKQPEVNIFPDGSREFFLPILSHNEERRWKVAGTGEVGFVTQAVWRLDNGPQKMWSAYDLALDLLSLLALCKEFWASHACSGDGRIYVELRVGDAGLARESTGFPALFYQWGKPLVLEEAAIHPTADPRRYASAQTDFDLGASAHGAGDVVARLMNALLAGLGHQVGIKVLKRNLTSMYQPPF